MPDEQITILCIDDNPTNRYVVQRYLEGAGFQVKEADSGEAGLQAIAQSPPDLIILDVRLPDISGFEVCQRLKESPSTASIPVLHLSAAYTRSQDRAQGLEMGADAYLVQPVEAVELLATVRALLRLYQAEQTAQRQSQEWQATFDAMNDGVCLLDAEGRVIRCNRAIETLLQQSYETLHHRHYFDLVRLPPEADQLEAACSESSNAENPPESFQQRLSLARLQETRQRARIEVPFQQQGKAGWVAITLDAILNEAGKLTGAVYIVTDITLQKQATVEREQVLLREQEARAASEAANRLKDDFLATLSHELRSPLNAILGWTKLLRTRPFNSTEATQALEIIERNTRTQTQLIEDLLDVSRIIQGKLRLKVQPTDLAMVIGAAIETVRPAAEAKSIRLHFSILEAEATVEPQSSSPTNYRTGFRVLGDSDRLQQIIWNLLSNAVKFTPKGGQVDVQLQQVIGETLQPSGRAASSPPSASLAQITVTDTGKGIPPEFLPYVFDRFRQADSSITRKYSGLGLGLSIVRHLVELHGGSVSASSLGEGQGATFVVQLPLLTEQEIVPSLSSSVDVMPSLEGLRVLVVDDEVDSRNYITTLLELYGATVVAVGSAQGVPQLLQTTPIDILVSDVGMPDEDGYSLIRRLRMLPAEQMPIAVALTGYARLEDRERALAAGFQSHLTKPVEPQTLVKTLADLSQRYV